MEDKPFQQQNGEGDGGEGRPEIVFGAARERLMGCDRGTGMA